MSELFGGGPRIPKPQPIPKPPQIDQAAIDADAEDQRRKRRGYDATVTGAGTSALSPANIGTHTLLGS